MSIRRNPTDVGVIVAVPVAVGLFVIVGDNVGDGVFVAVGATVAVKAKVTEFICFGVPFIGFEFASNPFLFTPLFDAHAVGPSAVAFIRSIL
jgi:hypothetical protein